MLAAMRKATHALVALVAVLHLWFLVLEMFLWTHPLGLKTFQQTAETAAQSAVLAANQGLYNGFLAAGLLLSFKLKPPTSLAFRYFFLACVVVAGVYGGLTAKPAIILIQAAPAALALALVWATRPRSV